jgi:hypothetical protein
LLFAGGVEVLVWSWVGADGQGCAMEFFQAFLVLESVLELITIDAERGRFRDKKEIDDVVVVAPSEVMRVSVGFLLYLLFPLAVVGSVPEDDETGLAFASAVGVIG